MTTRLTKLITPIKQSFLFAVFLMISMVSHAQLSVDAGSDTTFCAGPYFSDTMFIGKNAKIKNAIEPYSVSWNCKVPLGLNSYLTASSILNDTKIISPYIVFGPTITDSIKFYLTVTDHEGNFATDTVVVHFSFYPLTNDYQVIYMNKGDSVWLNGGIAEGETDSIYWQPKEGLSNPDQASTWCKPDTTTDYYFIKVDPFGCACPHLTYVVRVLPETNDNKPEFAPIGAEWHYNYDPDVTLDDGYQKITVLRDTIIDNKSCRFLQIRNIGYSYFYQNYYDYKEGNIFLYEKDNIVYYYKNKQFYVLYDFSAKAGDTYNSISYMPNCSQTYKVRIDSITFVEVDEQFLKNFHVTLNDSFQTNYIEKIGNNEYLLPQFGFGCEIHTGPHYPGPLRCYYDSDIGIYSTNIVSNCEYITSSIENKIFNDFKVYPNPADSYFTISNPSNIKINKIEMFDFSGRVVQMWIEPELAGNQLNIQHILPGIYLLKAETDAGIKTEKLVVR